MLCPQNRTAHCTCHARAPQKPRHLFRSAVCPCRGLVLRTNGGRRRFFGNIYFTNRPLVACSAINTLNNPGVYGTKLPWAVFGGVSFTGRGQERSGKTGRDRERLGGQSTTCRAGRWLGWPATNTVYFVPGPPNR